MSSANTDYEAAFESYLQARQIPYVPASKTHKGVFSGARIKSFDLLVYPGTARHWIVDVKGRQFPYRSSKGARRYWENWVSQEDLDGLGEWQRVFGDDFEARFVFAYLLDGPPDRWPPGPAFEVGDQRFAFMTVALVDYRSHCRRRSSSWDTVSVPRDAFRQIVQPVNHFGPRPS